VILRCVLDDLLLEAQFIPDAGKLEVFDGEESFVLEALEAVYYEVVLATKEDLIALERAGLRLLRRADDFAYGMNC
jgi:hypothetical protein